MAGTTLSSSFEARQRGRAPQDDVLWTLRKRLDAGDGAAEDQGVDVVGAFIGVDGFQVRGVAHHVIFDLDAVAAVHVTGYARDVERLAAIVALDDGNHLPRHLALVHQPADPQRGLQAERVFAPQLCDLFLYHS